MNDHDKDSAQPFSPDEIQRYARHFSLPHFGKKNQQVLRKSSVLIVGAGGLGCPAAVYLAAAGVGCIGIIDADVVEISNLQRQILHNTEDVGISKVESAKHRLAEINPNVRVAIHHERLTQGNAEAVIRNYDIIVDGSDNFPTRYLINDACHFLNKTWVYASIYQFEGQVSVFGHRHGPCYRCLYPSPPPPGAAPNCAEAGVLGVLPGVVGTLQATETIKLLTGIGESLSGRVLYYDAFDMSFRTFSLNKDRNCPLCGSSPSITSLVQMDQERCDSQLNAGDMKDEIDAADLNAMLQSGSPPFLVDVREAWEHTLCDIGTSHLIPVNELEKRTKELPHDQRVVLFCRTGVRSRTALDRIKGLPGNTCHLKGGIHAWADAIDSSIPKY